MQVAILTSEDILLALDQCSRTRMNQSIDLPDQFVDFYLPDFSKTFEPVYFDDDPKSGWVLPMPPVEGKYPVPITNRKGPPNRNRSPPFMCSGRRGKNRF
jgi:hypothetical protein